MAEVTSPTAWRRWLSIELRRLREDRNMAQKDAATACGWSGAKLSYLENGGQQPVEADLDKLLELYEVPEAQRERYYAAVKGSQTEGWWEHFEPLVGDWVPMFIGLEQGTSGIRSYEPLLIPGVLQTDEYATAIMHSGIRQRSSREVSRLVELRTTRQAILTRPKDPTEFDVVLDESVLQRSPDAPGVLGRQLQHLAKMAELPNVTLRVQPLVGGVQSFSVGPFSILSFPDGQPEPVVYLEHRGGAVWLEEFAAIERYELAFKGLVDMALDPETSLAMVQEATERHTR
jgi:transcriptional regulator with XRE-family HTH domain